MVNKVAQAMAKNFDFHTIAVWKGYNSANDKTNVAENIYVQGSQNIYKKISGTLANRPGLKRIGAADTTLSPVSSEFVWNTSWGATYALWISNGKLQVSIDNVWHTLLSSLTSTRYVFDKWFSPAEAKDRVLFVHGNSDIQHWSGGSANILSTTANSITKTGSITWQQAGFSTTGGEKSILINGNTYTYTGGENTTTLTGVSPDPTGEANGSLVLQSVITTANTPASGFNNDFIKVINNQVYVGSYTSRLDYISSDTDFTNYVVPTPRLPGSPELLTLDSTLNGIGVKNGNAWISIGTGEWAEISFNNITVGTTLTQETKVDVKPIAKLAAAYAHEFIGNVGDNIVYLSKDQQLRTVGDFNSSFVNAYPSLSQEIATELKAENFTGGGIKCAGEFIYLTSPVSGKTYLRQERQSVDANNTVVSEILWHSPFIWNATKVDEINGVIVVFSNANPQVYEAWDTGQFHDDSPSDEPLPYSCVLALSYNFGNRVNLLCFDKTFSEGYITEGTPLNLTVNYNYQGATNQIKVPINSIAQPARLFTPSVGSLGDSSLGDKTPGDEINVDLSSIDNPPKFKAIKSLALVNCFEYQLIYSSESADAQWEVLASGTNSVIDPDQDPTFIINKLRN